MAAATAKEKAKAARWPRNGGGGQARRPQGGLPQLQAAPLKGLGLQSPAQGTQCGCEVAEGREGVWVRGPEGGLRTLFGTPAGEWTWRQVEAPPGEWLSTDFGGLGPTARLAGRPSL